VSLIRLQDKHFSGSIPSWVPTTCLWRKQSKMTMVLQQCKCLSLPSFGIKLPNVPSIIARFLKSAATRGETNGAMYLYEKHARKQRVSVRCRKRENSLLANKTYLPLNNEGFKASPPCSESMRIDRGNFIPKFILDKYFNCRFYLFV
jgi:hypothetical protein